jgi:hypothetical protein
MKSAFVKKRLREALNKGSCTGNRRLAHHAPYAGTTQIR